MILSRYIRIGMAYHIRALGLLLLFAASQSKCIAILRARSWGSIALRRDRCTIVALCGIAAICTIYSKFKVQRSWPCLSRQNMHFRQYSFFGVSVMPTCFNCHYSRHLGVQSSVVKDKCLCFRHSGHLMCKNQDDSKRQVLEFWICQA